MELMRVCYLKKSWPAKNTYGSLSMKKSWPARNALEVALPTYIKYT